MQIYIYPNLFTVSGTNICILARQHSATVTFVVSFQQLNKLLHIYDEIIHFETTVSNTLRTFPVEQFPCKLSP